MEGQVFIAPEGFQGDGLFIGGGWHKLVATSAGPGVVMPAEGNWASLGGLGFVADPNAELAQTSVANDGFPELSPTPL